MYYKYCIILIALMDLSGLASADWDCPVPPAPTSPRTSNLPHSSSAAPAQPWSSSCCPPTANPAQQTPLGPLQGCSHPNPNPNPGQGGENLPHAGRGGKTCSDSFLPSATIQFPSLTPNMVLISFISSQLCCKAAVSHGINLCFH